MYAKTASELKQLILSNPRENPSVFLSDSSFAAACYDQKTVQELQSDFNGDADPEACEKWGISPDEWREQIAMALTAARAKNVTG